MRAGLVALSALICLGAADPRGSALRSYVVEGDAIVVPLTGQPGDAARGAQLMQQRQKSLCVLCHSGPFPDPHLHGTIAPDLKGVGSRLSAGQLRLRVVAMRRLNPESIMPTYYEAAGADNDARVAAAWRGKPILDAGEIEDLVAYLRTLR
jgi:L-cysteine S-thiosulfotransferase